MSRLTWTERRHLIGILKRRQRELLLDLHSEVCWRERHSWLSAMEGQNIGGPLLDVPGYELEHEERMEHDLEKLESIEEALRHARGSHAGECIGCGAGLLDEELRVNPERIRCAACEAVHQSRRESRMARLSL